MTCCGKERDSRFCPECGARLRQDSPLWGLVSYCRQRVKQHSKQAKVCDGWAEKDEGRGQPQEAEEFRERAGRSRELERQWQAWADDLVALLDRLADGGPTP